MDCMHERWEWGTDKCPDCETWIGPMVSDGSDHSGPLFDLACVCGCGSDNKYDFLAKFLGVLDAKGWKDEVRALVVADSEGAAELLMHWASENDITEHGTSVPGWVSGRGREFLRRYAEWTKRIESASPPVE